MAIGIDNYIIEVMLTNYFKITKLNFYIYDVMFKNLWSY